MMTGRGLGVGFSNPGVPAWGSRAGDKQMSQVRFVLSKKQRDLTMTGQGLGMGLLGTCVNQI